MPSLRQIRLVTGLVLFLYVTLHFANHALGNISVGAMERGLVIQKLIWQSLPGAVILYLSLLTHMSLGFWALYERRRFRWTRLEATQLVLGLSIPFLLANHVIGTRVALEPVRDSRRDMRRNWRASGSPRRCSARCRRFCC